MPPPRPTRLPAELAVPAEDNAVELIEQDTSSSDDEDERASMIGVSAVFADEEQSELSPRSALREAMADNARMRRLLIGMGAIEEVDEQRSPDPLFGAAVAGDSGHGQRGYATPSSTARALGEASDRPSGGADEPARRCDTLKWMSLTLLIVQNSALFLTMRQTAVAHPPDDHYHSTVVVVVIEVTKFLICYLLLAVKYDTPRAMLVGPLLELRQGRQALYELSLPALCYTGQNNLLFVAVSFLSASASQVLTQTKVLWTALFASVLLHKRYSLRQWASFVLLAVGVALVQGQDAKGVLDVVEEGEEDAWVAYTWGVSSALGAGLLSGLAGILLEMNYTRRRSSSLLLINLQLSIVSIPLALLAALEFDREAIAREGWLKGFHYDTLVVIFIQVVGGLLTAAVIKFAGNILKTFATSLAMLLTCLASMPLFGYRPTLLFWLGLMLTCLATVLYGAKPHAMLAFVRKLWVGRRSIKFKWRRPRGLSRVLGRQTPSPPRGPEADGAHLIGERVEQPEAAESFRASRAEEEAKEEAKEEEAKEEAKAEDVKPQGREQTQRPQKATPKKASGMGSAAPAPFGMGDGTAVAAASKRRGGKGSNWARSERPREHDEPGNDSHQKHINGLIEEMEDDRRHPRHYHGPYHGRPELAEPSQGEPSYDEPSHEAREGEMAPSHESDDDLSVVDVDAAASAASGSSCAKVFDCSAASATGGRDRGSPLRPVEKLHIVIN